jgi:hypothetical protein
MKKTPKRSSAKRTKKVAAPRSFFTTGRRGARGVDRTPLHVLITPDERRKLIVLSHKMKLNGADVVRALINNAKL